MISVRRLNKDFDMSFGQSAANFAKGSEAVAQNVRTRLYLILGEWFLNIDNGVPYLQNIFVKPADLPLVESIIKKRIAETEGVDEITSFNFSFNRETRQVIITATLTTIFDDGLQNIRIVYDNR